jgi:hypothetical protein
MVWYESTQKISKIANLVHASHTAGKRTDWGKEVEEKERREREGGRDIFGLMYLT